LPHRTRRWPGTATPKPSGVPHIRQLRQNLAFIPASAAHPAYLRLKLKFQETFGLGSGSNGVRDRFCFWRKRMVTKMNRLEIFNLAMQKQGFRGTENHRVGTECGPVRFRPWAPFLPLNVNKHAVLTHFGITKALY
jgi:hypothetical protein